ncbi:MAG: hypothetical protein M3178_12355 [Pseudomonadota bacterium]|nr:hypothetical protein [Pseudomonadota bacterium]
MNREQPNDFKRIPELAGAETEPASITGDAEGQKEAAAVAAGTLEEESKRAEHRRTERLRNHVNRAAIAAVWLFFLLFAFGIVAVAWHYLTPEKYAWLSDSQLTTLKTFLASGAITGTAGRYLAARIS